MTKCVVREAKRVRKMSTLGRTESDNGGLKKYELLKSTVCKIPIFLMDDKGYIKNLE